MFNQEAGITIDGRDKWLFLMKTSLSYFAVCKQIIQNVNR